MPRPLFGVSAAGYRCEGGFNGPGQPANQWAAWERAGMAPAGRGCDLWRRPEVVLDHAAQAGAEVFFFCVEWARVEPGPGLRDEEALERYAAICEKATDRGLTPVVALFDVAHPGWLGEEFWLMPGSPDRFAEHAAHVVSRLGDVCGTWVTLRQPNLVALAGWIGGGHPPRRIGAVADAWAVADNLLAAHVLVHRVLHDARSDARVLLGMRASAVYDWHALLVDVLVAPSLGVPADAIDRWVDERRAAHGAALPPGQLADVAARRAAMQCSAYGTRGPSRAPRRAVSLAFESPARPFDGVLVVVRRPWVGAAALPLLRAPGFVSARVAERLAPWSSRPDPEGLRAWCAAQARLTPGLPLWVEDGFASGPARPGGARDWDRASYVRAHATAVTEAAAVGAPVECYLYHSVAGGAEPTWPDADFGLFATGEGGNGGDLRWRSTDATGVDAAGAFAGASFARS